MKKILRNKSLIIIILLASLLRLWKLGSVPLHLTPDEASLGYNAYSILKTGKDEYGSFLPIVFKSFGDFKPGLYVYASIIPIAIFGLTEFAVRLPSALAGIAAVYLLFLIVKEFVKNKWLIVSAQGSKKTEKSINIDHQLLAIIASFLLAINPWHIHFSRGAWEANLSLTLTLAGIYYFLSSLKKQKYLVLSASFFGLTLLAYQGAKLSSLIVVAILTLIFRKEIFKFRLKSLISGVIVGLIISLPIIISLFGKTGRLQVFSIFSAPRSTYYIQKMLDQGNEKIGDKTYYLYHSEALNFLRGILGRWFNHFSPRFLFFEGDWQNERHSAPNIGQFLVADMLLIALGLFILIKSKGKFSKFILLWLVLSPLPAILSRDQVHAVRAINMLIPLTLISGMGLVKLINIFENKFWNKLAFMTFSLFYLLNYFLYMDAYYIHMTVHDAQYWYFGHREAVKEVQPFRNNASKIVFQQSYAQPYIYFLFYEKYDPSLYQKKSVLETNGCDVGLVSSLDNIEFRYLSWPFTDIEGGTIVVADYIAAPEEMIEGHYKVLKNIKYPGAKLSAFRVMEAVNEK